MSDMNDNNEVYHIVALKFEGEDRADQVVDLIKGQQRAADYKVKAWATVRVDEKGKAKVHQMSHGYAGAAVGAGVGAGTALLLTLLGGPVGLLAWAVGGALLGGVAGKVFTHQFDSDELKALAASFEPNSSALLVVIEDSMVEQLADEMDKHGASLVTVTVGDQMAGELAQFAEVDLGEEVEGAPETK